MVKNKYFRWLLFSIGAAASFTLAWSPFNLIPLIVVSIFLFLLLEQQIRETKKSIWWFILYLFIGIFSLNFLCTYWIWNASPGGAVAAWFIDTFLMMIPFLLFHIIIKKTGQVNYFIFISIWISIELLHSSWEFAYPWLVLGNAFAATPKIIQWYEYTGVFGGSFWVLFTSVACLKFYNSWAENKVFIYKKTFNIIFLYLLAPLFLSFYILYNRNNMDKLNNKYTNIVVVQPNINPYTEKFGGLSALEQNNKILNLSNTQTDANTHVVIFPETAIQEDIDELNFVNNKSIMMLDSFINKHNGLSVLTGASSYRFYFSKKEATPTARFYQDNLYYDYFNTAIFKNQTNNWLFYHKSKLVPGVENMPYMNVFSFLKDYVIELGGTSGGLGRDKEPTNFTDVNKVQYAPVICYESIFGEYVAQYVKKGANIICIITNDGWWGNTAGYKQHFEYAKLRAIENRRYVARSANTGISAFIDDEGNALQQTKWDEAIAIKQTLKVNSEITFYTQHGDYIALAALYYALFNIPILLMKRKK